MSPDFPKPDPSVKPIDFKPIVEKLHEMINEIVAKHIKTQLKIRDEEQAYVLQGILVNFISSNVEKVALALQKSSYPEYFNLWAESIQTPDNFKTYINRMLRDNRLWLKIAGEHHFEVADRRDSSHEVIEHLFHGPVK